MRCKVCNVEVSGMSQNCPLCGSYINIQEKDRCMYPDVKNVSIGHNSKKFKIFFFIAILTSIVLFTVNILTYSKYLWFIIPVSAIWLTFFLIGIPLFKRELTPKMIVLDTLASSAFLVLMDCVTGYKGWSMSYVVPFLIFGSSAATTCTVMLKKMTWKEFYLFQMSIVAICFIPILARIFFKFVFWPSIISAVYGLITIIGMFILGDRKFKFETKKRFHF